jgi:hypothetical protein
VQTPWTGLYYHSPADPYIPENFGFSIHDLTCAQVSASSRDERLDNRRPPKAKQAASAAPGQEKEQPATASHKAGEVALIQPKKNISYFTHKKKQQKIQTQKVPVPVRKRADREA